MHHYIIQAASNSFMDDPVGWISAAVATVVAWFIQGLVYITGLVTLAQFVAEKFASTMTHLHPKNWLLKGKAGE